MFTLGDVLADKYERIAAQQPRSIAAIANECQRDWKKVYFGAVPYLSAMGSLNDMQNTYGDDSAKSIVLYFLSNATSWRGEVAKRCKAELKAMLKTAR